MNGKCSLKLCVLPVLITLVGSIPGHASDFTGRVIIHMQNEIDTMHLFVKGSSYLLQGTLDSMKVNVLVDPGRQIVDAWSPSDKEYHEDSLSDMGAAFLDPFAAINVTTLLSKATPQKMGMETVQDYSCDKYRLSMEDGTPLMEYWVSQKLRFPIKIVESGQGAMTLTVDEIRETPVDAFLLKLPAGMTLAVDPGEAPPTWAADIAKAPLVTIPYKKMMAAGEVIRVIPKIGQKIEVMCDHSTNGTQFCGAPFKDGSPTGNIMMGTFNLDAGENWTEAFDPFSASEDEIVIRMNKGSGLITVRPATEKE